MARDYRLYRCNRCDNVWVTEDTFIGKADVCSCCRSSDVNKSIVLPQGVAVEMLRRNSMDTTFDISKVIEDSSVRVWNEKIPDRNEVFEQQVHLMVSLYTIMRRQHEREE
jgi:hypothetical protein